MWYEDQQSGLGTAFLEEIKNVFNQIQNMPKGFEVLYKNTRLAFTSRFPFSIHYKIEEETVIVLAVLHTSRNPEKFCIPVEILKTGNIEDNELLHKKAAPDEQKRLYQTIVRKGRTLSG